MIIVDESDWLVVVDYQNDFIPPDGALAVPGGEELLEKINNLLEMFPHSVATRDWHPEDHYSFEKNGGVWPVHCLQGTRGAEYHPRLKTEELDDEIKAGFDPEDKDDYSGFSGENEEGIGLEEILNDAGAERLFLVGLAQEYCVKETGRDGLDRGFEVFLLEDCTEPVDEEDGEKAIEELKSDGGGVVQSTDLVF